MSFIATGTTVSEAQPGRDGQFISRWGAALGLTGLAILSVAPLLLERVPVHILGAYTDPIARWVSHGGAVFLLGLSLALRARADALNDPGAEWRMATFALLAMLMTFWHLHAVDLAKAPLPPEQRAAGLEFSIAQWQVDVYESVLSHRKTSPRWPGWSHVPHVFRPLPYGFTRTLELLTRDWQFSCFIYRWFFMTWFLWASYELARLFHGPARSFVVALVTAALYPFSIWYYWGQLTDPMSHALFVLSLIYVIQDRWLSLAASIALGVLAKETVLIVVPAYLVCYWRKGLACWLRTVGLGIAALTAYLAARFPLGWQLGYASINATGQLMIAPNLWDSGPTPSPAPIYQNYLFPAIYIGAFIPFIVVRWRSLDYRLKALGITVTPLLLATSLCFGWLHEARNYLPLVPLLMTMSLPSRPEH
jgi:hypothetical protein